eukprot:TRINITY_DN3272_c0_g1_i7.p1 TRINITY_DN3272_c0_g1~~TRINITY_DN3272_c0_g1_i7.p1  ORF type:complete len:339 (+),score=95.15 TRINITY_DN3272_c0_g1_i7:619-1635(+)
MEQLLGAMNYCHMHNIVHRDLKPENIYVDSIVDSKRNVRIINFGNALECPKNKKILEVVGTPNYIAPEVIEGKYTSKCDVWSLGVIMYVLLSGTYPFNGETDEEIMEAIKLGEFNFDGPSWKKVSNNAKDLIKKLLTYNQEERITAGEALKHPWIKSRENNELNPSILSNLAKFGATSKLQYATMMCLATQKIDKNERQELEKIFKKLDANGDGHLSREELVEGYKKLYKNEEEAKREVEKLMANMDGDGSGSFEYSEFLAAASNTKKLLSKQNVKEAFDMFDLDKSGSITTEEVKKILGAKKNISEETWKEMVKELDPNGDGQISYEEFEKMLIGSS